MKILNKVQHKMIIVLSLFVFIFGQIANPTIAQAQVIPAGYQPAVLLGLKIHPENPLLFDFIVDRGQAKLSESEFKAETEKLVKYFLTALTIPDKESWVNLSPHEANQIIPDALGKTEMGKTMLQQDYVLKQLAASLTNPQTDFGNKYWQKINHETNQKFDFLSRVWIVPQKAKVLENNGIVIIDEKRLKVLMADSEAGNVAFQEMILPKINELVNESQDFAAVRQVYNSVILAAWYKQALKESLLGKVYVDQAKVAGVETDDKQMKERVYQQYLEAFKKGAYSFIKEEENLTTGDVLPRKYFSGGIVIAQGLGNASSTLVTDHVPVSAIHEKLSGHPGLVMASASVEEPKVAWANAVQEGTSASSAVNEAIPLSEILRSLGISSQYQKQIKSISQRLIEEGVRESDFYRLAKFYNPRMTPQENLTYFVQVEIDELRSGPNLSAIITQVIAEELKGTSLWADGVSFRRFLEDLEKYMFFFDNLTTQNHFKQDLPWVATADIKDPLWLATRIIINFMFVNEIPQADSDSSQSEDDNNWIIAKILLFYMDQAQLGKGLPSYEKLLEDISAANHPQVDKIVEVLNKVVESEKTGVFKNSINFFMLVIATGKQHYKFERLIKDQLQTLAVSSGIDSPGFASNETVQATGAREPLTASSPLKDFLQQYFGTELPKKVDVNKSYSFPGSEVHNVLSAPRATHPFIAQHLLSFKDFMDLALHHQDWGFYSSGKVKFLAGHDFITYPQTLSPFFGQAVANQAFQVWQKMREQKAIASDEKFLIVEFGAGNAILARDFLNYVIRQSQENSAWKTFYEQMEYRIYERSAALRKRQKDELIEFKGKVRILEGDARMPLKSLSLDEIKGMIVTNEVPDAFGVHKVIVRESGDVEVGFVLPSLPNNFMTLFGTVGIPDKLIEKIIQANLDIKFAWGQDGGLNPQVIYLTQDTYTDLMTWAQYALSEGDLIQFLYYLKFNEIYLPVEYAPEVARYLKENIDEIALGMTKKSQRLVSAVNLYVNTEAMSFAEGLAKSLRSGVVMTIDYGESLAKLMAHEGTFNKLRTYGPNNMRNHDPYFQVGMQDITTEQDFTTLASTGEKFGLDQTHFGSLKGFFARTGLLSQLMYDPEVLNSSSTSAAVERILGEYDNFKVLTQAKGVQLQDIYDHDTTDKGFETLTTAPQRRFTNGAQTFARDFTDRLANELQKAIVASSGVQQKPWDDQEWFTLYDFLRSDVKPSIAQAVKNVIQKHLPSSVDPVVELGSGQGFFASLVPELQHRLIQTDYIGESLKRNPQPTAKWVTNAEALAIADQSVSAIVGYDFLDALPDLKRAAQEIYRVLKPDGQMLGFLDFAPHYEPAINYTKNIKNEVLFLAPQVDPKTGRIAMSNYARVNADELRYRLSQARDNSRGQIDEALNYLDQYLRDPKTELGHVMEADDPKVQYEYSVNIATLLNMLDIHFRVVSQEDVYKEMISYYMKKSGFNTVDFTMESGMIDYDRQDFLGFPEDKNVYEYMVGKKTNLYDPSIPKGKIRVIAHLLVVRAQKTDRASASVEANEATRQDLGGIDFDPSKLNLQIKRDGKGVPLPLPQQNIESIHLDGLFPVIINIQPVNSQTLPLLLGQAGNRKQGV